MERIDENQWRRFRDVRLHALLDAAGNFGIASYESEVGLDEMGWRMRAAWPATFVATVDGVDVGMLSVHHMDEGLVLKGAWISPTSRGQSLLKQLVDACVEYALSENAASVRLWFMDTNRRAEKAYRRLGFEPTGEQMTFEDGHTKRCMTISIRA